MRAPCTMGDCAGKQCPEGSSSCLQRTQVRAKGREEEAERSSVCGSVCATLPSRSTVLLSNLRQCGDAVTSAEQGQDRFLQPWEQVGTFGDQLWLWMQFSHHLLLPRRVLGNLGISHFPMEIIALHSLIDCISQWVILGERRGGTTRLLGLSFCINALSPFHCSCVLPRSPLWMPQQSKLLVVVNPLKSYMLLARCKFFSHAWFSWKSSASLIRSFPTVTLQFL